MIKQQEKMETQSQISSSSEAGPFITYAKTGKAKFEKPRPDSPMTKAAKALAIMNGQGDADLDDDDDHDRRFVSKHGDQGQQALDLADHLEEEMNQMFRDLDNMSKHIKENKDLNSMEGMMDCTKDIITSHTKTFDTLKNSLEQISKMAENDMKALDFYDEDGKEKDSYDELNSKIRELQAIQEERVEDDVAIEIQGGGTVSHEAQK